MPVASLLSGLIVGEFLNTVIYRVPKMIYEDHPTITSTDIFVFAVTLPLLSSSSSMAHFDSCIRKAIFLRGRCGFCHEKISPLYPSIEIISALVSVVVVWRFGLNVAMLAALVFSYMMIALSTIDYLEKILPDEITLSLLWLGLLINLQDTFTPLSSAVIGAVAGYLAFWILNQLCVLILKKQGLGYGDMKLLAAFGAWFGWEILPWVVTIAATLGLLVTIPLILTSKINRQDSIAFGHYLCISGWLFLIFSEYILNMPFFHGGTT
ncbi:MAG: prepilin peptidase [Candidatus Oxydemutatoraceae bacterium WSBS_2016_MAG_OTU14]